MGSNTGTVLKSAKRPQPKGGSRKGVPNKVTKQLKDMILGALDDAGGQAFLTQCAGDEKTRSAFLTLLGKVLPTESRLANPDGTPLQGLSVAPVFQVTMAAPKKK